MTITCNRSMLEVAKDIVLNRDISKLYQSAEIIDGYVLCGKFVGDWKSIWKEWESSNFPFGEENWKRIYKHFGSLVETDENSVHNGAKLPKNGVAVLPCDGFCLLLRQEIVDSGWWHWRWDPVALLGQVQ